MESHVEQKAGKMALWASEKYISTALCRTEILNNRLQLQLHVVRRHVAKLRTININFIIYKESNTTENWEKEDKSNVSRGNWEAK